jgi:hypothetical protein
VRIAGGQLAEIEDGAAVRADGLDVGASGAQTWRFVDKWVSLTQPDVSSEVV